MEVLVAGYEIIEQKSGIDGMYEAAELPGRICYHSMDRKTDESAKPFCDKLMENLHGAPLEHGSVYLKILEEDCDVNTYKFYMNNKYTSAKYVTSQFGCALYVTTNLRVLFENGRLNDLKYWLEPTCHHEKRVMVRFTIDRFTGEEFLRHRVASFNRESTRYVCFTKEKFGGGSIKFIVPCWMLDEDGNIPEDLTNALKEFDVSFESKCGEIFTSFVDDKDLLWNDFDYWLFALKATEWSYVNLVNKFGWQAQQARTVLPCAINSPLIKTAFIKDWIHFFHLRAIGTTGAPHPQAKELALPLMFDFVDNGLLTKKDLIDGLNEEDKEKVNKLFEEQYHE